MLGHHHATTTQCYAHLAADPVKDGVDKIGATIAAALLGNRDGVPPRYGTPLSFGHVDSLSV